MLTVGLSLVGALWKSISRFISSPVEVAAVICNLKHSTKAKGIQSGHRGSGGNQAGFSVAVLCCPHLGSDLMPGAKDTTPQMGQSVFSRRSWSGVRGLGAAK